MDKDLDLIISGRSGCGKTTAVRNIFFKWFQNTYKEREVPKVDNTGLQKEKIILLKDRNEAGKSAKNFGGSINPSTVLSTEGLKKSFDGQEVLKDVNLELQRGEIVLLRGDNGSGKTTLLNILTGNLEPDAGTINIYANGIEEHFHFPRKWYHNLNPFDHFTPERVAREGIGRTWQEVRLFSTMNLQDNIALAYPRQKGENPFYALIRSFNEQEKHNLNVSNERLEKLGLKGRETSSADMISLGQSKRVAIGMALHAGAKILFLDEPLAGLDKDGVRDIIEQLKLITREKQITLVIVEHIFNMPAILEIASKVWTLKNGKISIQSAEDVALKFSYNSAHSIKDVILNTIPGQNCIKEESLLCGAKLTHIVRNKKEFSVPMLEIENIVVRRGKRLVIGEKTGSGSIKGLSFKLYNSDICLLQAPNGWGKTTLLEAICGLIPIEQGTIRLHGIPLNVLPPWERASLGLSFLQSRNYLFPGLTVRESLQICDLNNYHENLKNVIDKRVSNLSGGEKQNVAITLALGRPHRCLLMDEPFSTLDAHGSRNLINILSTITAPILIVIPSVIQRS